jgi:hypothetical protein
VTHETLINIVLGAHFAILSAAFAVWLYFSIFSNNYRNWRNDIEDALRKLKRDIAVSLSEKLKPILKNAGAATNNILDSNGNYLEKVVDPTEGESYLNALFGFINDKTHEMARYRSLFLTHNACSFWAAYLTWSVLILMVLEIIILTIIGYYEKLDGNNISDLQIKVSFSISGIVILFCFLGLVFLIINHNKGIKNRGCND